MKTPQLKMWEGEFGLEYTNRSYMSTGELDALYIKYRGITRSKLNELFLGGIDKDARILEVGTNIGNQLLLLQDAGFTNLYGIEPQDYAVNFAKRRSKNISIIKGTVFDIPFKDDFFDVVFISGVLIHIAPSDIQWAMVEIHRCSKKYIWGFEYYADKHVMAKCRGHDNLLWNADFVKMYLAQFADLKLVKEKRMKCLLNANIDIMFLLRKESK